MNYYYSLFVIKALMVIKYKDIFLISKNNLRYNVSLSEWLRSLIRNQMGLSRAGSNPAADVF